MEGTGICKSACPDSTAFADPGTGLGTTRLLLLAEVHPRRPPSWASRDITFSLRRPFLSPLRHISVVSRHRTYLPLPLGGGGAVSRWPSRGLTCLSP